MAGCVCNVKCPKCKQSFATRIRLGEDGSEICPHCAREFTVDLGKLTAELRKMQIDSELSVME